MSTATISTGKSLQLLGPSVPGRDLSAYVTSVNSIAILTAEEERELARRYYHEEDLEAARQLVLAHLRFVVHLARSYSGYGLSQSDLIQEGNVGLMKAVKRFNPDMGVRLVSFAVHWIKAEIHEFILRNWRIVKIATTKAQRKLFFNLRSKKQGYKADAAAADAATHRETLSEYEIDLMARELNVKREEVIEMETRLSGGDVMLDPGPADDGEEAYGPIAYLSDANHEPTAMIEAHQRDVLGHLAQVGLLAVEFTQQQRNDLRNAGQHNRLRQQGAQLHDDRSR